MALGHRPTAKRVGPLGLWAFVSSLWRNACIPPWGPACLLPGPNVGLRPRRPFASLCVTFILKNRVARPGVHIVLLPASLVLLTQPYSKSSTNVIYPALPNVYILLPERSQVVQLDKTTKWMPTRTRPSP